MVPKKPNDKSVASFMPPETDVHTPGTRAVHEKLLPKNTKFLPEGGAVGNILLPKLEV